MEGDVLIGRALGRYELEGVLGHGSFATVYRAVQHGLERPVAVKVLDPLLARNPLAARRFALEGRATAALDHPAIVPVYEAGAADGYVYLAMRLVEGPTLADALAASGPPGLASAVHVATRVGAALDHAHERGIVHRDVKPSNVLLEGGRFERAWLADFGIAATARTAGAYTIGPLRTAAYMAPEQARPSEVGPPADRYALACVVFEMVTGRPPYPGNDSVELLSNHATAPVPATGLPAVDAVLRPALAKRPEDRPSSCAAFATAFAAAADQAQPAPTAPLPLPRRRTRRPRRGGGRGGSRGRDAHGAGAAAGAGGGAALRPARRLGRVDER